jgi:hypothetical protein
MAGGLALACAALAGCATTPADPVCAAIRDFANATPAGSTQAVELTTRWMADDPLSTGAYCRDAGYAPGRPLCKALVDHASREFPVGNVQRVLSCMSGNDRFGLPIDSVRSLSGEIVSRETPGVKEAVTLTLIFDVTQRPGPQAHPPLLRLVAERAQQSR